MRISLYILFILFSIFHSAFAQYENHNWYYGGNSRGIKFNPSTNVPTQNNTHSMYTVGGPFAEKEGCAVATDRITDSILFYSDGSSVWDKNHVMMQDGDSIGNSSSINQAIAICPVPGATNKFYLFSNNYNFSGTTIPRIHYSIVDMNLNGGVGGVVLSSKNTFLIDSLTEGMVMIPNANGTDYWLLTHKGGSDKFILFKITTSGVSYFSDYSAGQTTYIGGSGEIMNLNYSKEAGKVAVTYYSSFIPAGDGGVYTFDFDNAFGGMCNFQTVDDNPDNSGANQNTVYDTEWSPDGTKLYYATVTRIKIYQWDFNTLTRYVLSQTASVGGGGLKLGPDGKIYIIRLAGTGTLSIINDPDSAGVLCNYQQDVFATGGNQQGYQFPEVLEYADTTQMVNMNFLGNDTTLCSGGNILLNAGYPGASYTWTPISVATQTLNVTNAGIYSVSVNINGCIKNDTITIALSPSPTITLSPDTSFCAGNSVSLSAAGAGSYTWSPVAGLSGTTGSSVNAMPTGTTGYTVTGTNGCGADTAVVTVTMNLLPVLNVSPGDSVCPGNSATLTASGASTYTWSSASGLSSTTGSSVIATPLLSLTYTVTGVDANGCSQQAFVSVNVNNLPLVNAQTDTTIFLGDSVVITAAGGQSYSWYPSIGLSSTTGSTITATPAQTTKYYVLVTDANGCTGIDSVLITVGEKCEDIFIPTAFSPNNDGANDIYFLQGNCVNEIIFTIYDRWGEIMFEATDILQGWDGTYKNQELNTGVFVYSAIITMDDENTVVKHGNISLVR